MNHEQFWQTVLEALEVEVSKANFATWLKFTSVLSLTESELLISVPNGFTKEWLLNHYNKTIYKIVQNIKPEINKIQYIIGKKVQEKAQTSQATEENTNKNRVVIIKNNPNLILKKQELESNLNKRYSFDTFIAGPSNELAMQACVTIAKHPGIEYNPLFVYGGVGLGKTHLIQSTGIQILKNFPDKKVCYLTSERFLNEVFDYIANKATSDLRKKYREVDALIIDDIQFLGGKAVASEELFNTFNHLYERNKQIIISSDRLPSEILDLEDRLRSRFEGGMMVDIQKPDMETRFVILRKMAESKNFEIDGNILNFIAENFDNNIRELQGAFNTVLANFSLRGTKPDFTSVSLLLKNSIAAKPKNIINFKHILKEVSDFFDISVQELINRCRKKEIVYPRQIAMYLLRKELNNSFPTIGEKLGGRDHTTVMHACEKIEKELKENNLIERDIKIIRERLYSNI